MAKILSQIVEVCVFRIFGGEPQYLLLQRSSDDSLYPNLWQIVTGTAAGDKNAKETALRELEEETGLFVNRLWVVPFVDSYYDCSKDSVQVVPVFAVETLVDSEVKLSDEHQKYEWLNYQFAYERLVWPGHRQILDIVNQYIAGGIASAKFSEIQKK